MTENIISLRRLVIGRIDRSLPADNFLPLNDGILILHFNQGRVQVMEESAPFDVEIELSIEHFSSIFMGVVPFKTLINYGLVKISDISYLDIINRLFLTEQPPITTQQF